MSKSGVTLTLLLACVGLSLVGGCRRTSFQQQQYIAMLDAEKRSLEDIIYRQEAEYEVLIKQLKKCRSERDANKIGTGFNGSDSSPSVEEPELDVPSVEMPSVEMPSVEVPDVDVPGVEIPNNGPLGVDMNGADGNGVAPVPANPLPAPVNPAPVNPAPVNPVPVNPVPGNSAPPANRGPLPPPANRNFNAQVDNEISHIVINRLETRGVDMNRQSGDDGLRVVVEPRNKDELYLPQFGHMSVVVLDPQKSGEDARVARWEFDADAVSKAVYDTRENKGIYLQMKWPSVPPTHSHLRLYVRMHTETGERFETQGEIFVHMPNQTAQWTPRADRTRFADSSPNEVPVRTAEAPSVITEENSLKASDRPSWSPNRPTQ